MTRRLRAAAAGLLVASAGCASVLDLSGYTFVDEGEGGEGGAGGGSGAAGGRTCPVTVEPEATYARGCALAVACTSATKKPSLSECIVEDRLPNFSNADCIRTKSDCDGYFGCTGERGFTTTSCDGSGWTCDGDVATGCEGARGVRVDCKLYGGECRPSAVIAPGVSLSYPCELAEVSCNGSVEAPACSGSEYSYQCAGGRAYGRSCDKVGLCSVGGLCTISAESCQEPGTASCQKDRALLCSSNGVARQVDCPAAGLACAVTPGGGARCLAAGCSEDDLALCNERCEGTQALLCLGGARFVFDCATIGARCAPDGAGAATVSCRM